MYVRAERHHDMSTQKVFLTLTKIRRLRHRALNLLLLKMLTKRNLLSHGKRAQCNFSPGLLSTPCLFRLATPLTSVRAPTSPAHRSLVLYMAVHEVGRCVSQCAWRSMTNVIALWPAQESGRLPPQDIAFPQKTTIADTRPSSVAVIRVGVSLYGYG